MNEIEFNIDSNSKGSMKLLQQIDQLKILSERIVAKNDTLTNDSVGVCTEKYNKQIPKILALNTAIINNLENISDALKNTINEFGVMELNMSQEIKDNID